MIEVDISELKVLIRRYEEVLKNIEENNTDIMYNFKDLSKNWQDERSNKLQSSFQLENQRYIKLEENIKKHLEIYKEIENGYKQLGNKIKCNLEAEELIMTKLNNIIALIGKILEQFRSLGDISFYHRAYLVEKQKSQMEKVYASFKEIKQNIKEKYTKIKEIEKNVTEALATISIEKFVLNNYESEE